VLERPTQARVAFHIPYVGFALGALSDRHIRMMIIGLPALLIALGVLARLWRDAGEEVRRQREPAAQRSLEAGS
jgi:signal peptidase